MKEQAGSLATFTTSLLLYHSNLFRKGPLCIIGFTIETVLKVFF